MPSNELQDKVARLPAWAREHIRRLEVRAEPNVDELVRLRREVARLQEAGRKQQDRIDAMVAMFQCAAKGGNEVAAAVQRIVEDWLVSDEYDPEAEVDLKREANRVT